MGGLVRRGRPGAVDVDGRAEMAKRLVRQSDGAHVGAVCLRTPGPNFQYDSTRSNQLPIGRVVIRFLQQASRRARSQ